MGLQRGQLLPKEDGDPLLAQVGSRVHCWECIPVASPRAPLGLNPSSCTGPFRFSDRGPEDVFESPRVCSGNLYREGEEKVKFYYDHGDLDYGVVVLAVTIDGTNTIKTQVDPV